MMMLRMITVALMVMAMLAVMVTMMDMMMLHDDNGHDHRS